MSSGDYNPGGGSDVFVERTSQSWFGRILGGFVSILIGLILVIAAAILLFWNEGRAAKTAAALAEGSGLVVSIDSNAIDPSREGKLIHISGPATLGAPAEDSDFRFPADALKLARLVEMFEWKEESRSQTQKKLGGGEETVTTYTYSKNWSDRAIDSGRFREASGHRNPAFPNLRSREYYPKDVKLGAFSLGPNLLRELSATEPYSVPDSALEGARSVLGARARIAEGGVYTGADPDQPEVGDIRVTWHAAPVGDVSVVGAQSHSTLSPFVTSNGRELLLVESGDVDAKLMFKHGEDENRILTWILRAVGFVAMFIGFRLMISLAEILADFVPLIGSIVGAGASLIAFFATLVLAPLIMAVAWVVYRPLVALIILVVGGGLAYAVHALARRRAPPRPAAATPA